MGQESKVVDVVRRKCLHTRVKGRRCTLCGAFQTGGPVFVWTLPATPPGVCCRCGCTDERACEGGCSWAHPTHTLCSKCVGELNGGAT
jgi:hypothetical protein